MSCAEAEKAGSFLQVNSEHQEVFPAPSLLHPYYSLYLSLPLSLEKSHGGRRQEVTFECNDEGGGYL